MTAAQAPNDGPSGLLLVDKPEAITSHDVVDAVRRLLGTRRVGHTGTLDPAATGLLVLCVGRAGRLQSFLTELRQELRRDDAGSASRPTPTIGKGLRSATPHPDPRPDPEAVRAACSRYVGEFDQAPPPVLGQEDRRQEVLRARPAGARPSRTSRRRSASPGSTPSSVEGDVARFHVDCSSGTYIRSLAHDVGKELELGAHLASLRRTRIGPFSLENARTLAALGELPAEARTSPPSWIPAVGGPAPLPRGLAPPGEAAKVKRGHAVPVRVPPEAAGAPWIRLLCSGELVALGHLEPLGRGVLALVKPKIVLQD